MPTYEYRCHECEHQFEVFQKMSDDPVSDCEVCGGPVRRVLFPVAIHFKGSGFYTTDYARKKTLPASGGNGSSESSDSNGNSSSEHGNSSSEHGNSSSEHGNGSSGHGDSGGSGASRSSSSSSSEAGATNGGASKKAETSAKKGSVVSSKTGDS